MTIFEHLVIKEDYMGRAFSEKQITKIKSDLMDIAEDLLLHNSVRKITVDDLVNKANIAKGTFYRFYNSKEHLFYNTFLKKHDEIQGTFLKDVKLMSTEMTPDKFADVIMKLFHSLNDSFLMNLISRGDLQEILLNLPEEIHEEHLIKDQLSMKQLSYLFPHLSESALDVFTAAIRIALTSVIHIREIGQEHFYTALQLTLKGIATQMMEVQNDFSK